VSLTLQRKISQLTNKQNQQQPAPSVTVTKPAAATTNEDQALKNITNSNILPLAMDHGGNNSNDDDFISVDEVMENEQLVTNANENIENNATNYYNNPTNDTTSNIAGSLVHSADISSKLSEYINSNLPQIEKSINNHLANSDSTMSIASDLKAQQQQQQMSDENKKVASGETSSSFIKTHRKQLSDESFHHVQIVRNSTLNATGTAAASVAAAATAANSKRSIKKTRVIYL
jgi:hypothetical protein